MIFHNVEQQQDHKLNPTIPGSFFFLGYLSFRGHPTQNDQFITYLHGNCALLVLYWANPPGVAVYLRYSLWLQRFLDKRY